MSTFTVGAVAGTFTATINGSSQEAGELERLSVTLLVPSAAEWTDLLSLVTTKYHVHVPLGGNIVIDVARGVGAGALVITGLGTTTALLVDLRRTQYLRAGQSIAQAVFLLTAVWS